MHGQYGVLQLEGFIRFYLASSEASTTTYSGVQLSGDLQ